MGEAKRKREAEEAARKLVKPMKRARFCMYTMGSRRSTTPYMSEEVSWWSSHDERLLGLALRDTIDDDYLWIMLARSEAGRFRCVDLETSLTSQEYAEKQLFVKMADAIRNNKIEELGIQGDETNSPIKPFEVFSDLGNNDLHPYYKFLKDLPCYAPARWAIEELALWLAPSDPHFIREFQTGGFDQRLWEMYLWAAFREFYLDIEQMQPPSPDFLCKAPGTEFTVEATTVAPSQSGVLKEHPNPNNSEEREEFLRNYMPMKFGSALNSKLNRRYWEKEECKGKPFVIAIADFHEAADAKNNKAGSMTYTQSALWQYLYGHRVTWGFDGDKITVREEKITDHEYRGKVIPSGFFDQENAENVSAVIFSNAGTISKFNRMGLVAGCNVEDHEYFRVGYRHNPDPEAIMGIPFQVNVKDENYEEYWTQEIQVLHNPKAKRPLPIDALPGATHFFYEDGQFLIHAPKDAILGSMTMSFKKV